tara:strand:+ start:107 stop:1375 length:1269 start_codon:yes stop_codon:yes gene_type:complete
MNKNNDYRIAVIGLGYVGLPLAVRFGMKYNTLGFDINESRINQLNQGKDITNEITGKEISNSKQVKFSYNEEDLKDSNIYIVTVPTPINRFREPNLNPLINATETIGKYLNKGDIIVYESTVFPGCTEENCVPILEEKSNLKYKIDFTCGYSPERIVPGDKERTLTKIQKIVSGSDSNTTKVLDDLYNSIIDAGTYIAPSIKIAEAAKAIENAQRDINIAFINELALIFDKMDLDTHEIIKAASTKWNFLPFSPGLVGGHCIGVDPYYLAYKSVSYGHHPKLILAGREINDNMSDFVAKKVMKAMTKANINIENSNVLVLGITFKENCSDIRNTKVIDVIKTFKQFRCNVDVFDPIANKEEVQNDLKISLVEESQLNKNYNAILKLVPHQYFNNFKFSNYSNSSSIIFDLKGTWSGDNILSL